MDGNQTPDRFYETIAFGESEAPMLWEVRIQGGSYICRSTSVSVELAAMYMLGEVGDRTLTRADFITASDFHTFSDIRAAYDWFATDWDVHAQSSADQLFAQIEPAWSPHED